MGRAEDKSWEDILGTSPPTPERQSQCCPSPPWKQLQLLEFPSPDPGLLVVISPSYIKSWATQSACSSSSPVLWTVPTDVNAPVYTAAVSSPAKTCSTWDTKADTASEGSIHEVTAEARVSNPALPKFLHLLTDSRNAVPLLPGDTKSQLLGRTLSRFEHVHHDAGHLRGTQPNLFPR